MAKTTSAPDKGVVPKSAVNTPANWSDSHHRLAIGVMLASGFAALGYQIVWTHQNALWLGHESAAVLAVVCAFFFGFAAGAFFLGDRIAASAYPGRWYAACEAIAGGWSLALIFFMGPASEHILALIGERPSPAWQWSIAFAATAVLLLPATSAMGATLPALEKYLSPFRRDTSNIAALYAANTFGAVLGVICTTFWLIPAIGFSQTAIVCVVLNVFCAAASLALFGKKSVALKQVPLTLQTQPQPQLQPTHQKRLAILLVLTGLLGLGYEVVAIRVLSLVTENTVYTFAIMLAVYLVGTAIGAAAYWRWAGTWLTMLSKDTPIASDGAILLRDRLLQLLAFTCLVGLLCLGASQWLSVEVAAILGQTMTAALAAESAIAIAAFLLPTIAMGALFSHLCAEAPAQGISFGRALALNTAGASVAPLLFGVAMLPVAGAKTAILLIAVGYLSLLTAKTWSKIRVAYAMSSVAALMIWAPSLRFVDVPAGGKIISYEDGALAAVSVVADADGVARLRINNRQQEGSSATLYADARQALIPTLLHPSPKHALFLGVGTSVTASVAADEKTLVVDAVELLPEVIKASAIFRKNLADSATGANPRLNLASADARRFVRTSTQQYDLIVADNFHPARSGSGSLYTREHFAAVRARLATDGIFCQWLPLHQLDLATLRIIVKTFISIYPNSSAVIATNSLETPVVGLIGRAETHYFDRAKIVDRLNSIASTHRPQDFGFADEIALFGSFIAGPEALIRFAANAPINTDDHPIVSHLAPQETYAPSSAPRDRIHSLLSQVDIRPSDLLLTPDDEFATRLSIYWSARNYFIDVGRAIKPFADPVRMLAQVRDPLLNVLKISPDFRPAYDPLLRLAIAVGHHDRALAAPLLTELNALQPRRPDAADALRQLGFVQPTPPGTSTKDRSTPSLR
jgi:spermidine synthase